MHQGGYANRRHSEGRPYACGRSRFALRVCRVRSASVLVDRVDRGPVACSIRISLGVSLPKSWPPASGCAECVWRNFLNCFRTLEEKTTVWPEVPIGTRSMRIKRERHRFGMRDLGSIHAASQTALDSLIGRIQPFLWTADACCLWPSSVRSSSSSSS
jgi:hypothetical protein